jgi:hypothetical protein
VTVTVDKATPQPIPAIAGTSLRINTDETGTLTAADNQKAFADVNPNPGDIKITGVTADDHVTATPSDNAVTYNLNTTAEADKHYEVTVSFSSANYSDSTVTLSIPTYDKTKVDSLITFEGKSVTYTGKEQTYAKAKLKNLSTKNLTYKYEVLENGTLSENGLPLGAGTYKVTAIYDDANQHGEKDVTFTIEKAKLTLGTVKVPAKGYDNTTTIDPTKVTVTLTGLVGAEKTNKPVAGTDYKITAYYKDSNVGTQDAYVTVDLLDSLSKNYTWKTADGNNKTVKSSITQGTVEFDIQKIEDQFYDGGNEIKPEIVPINVDGLAAKDSLQLGRDYIVKYKNNKNAGTATVTVSPNGKKGNYTFKTKTVTFTIKPTELGTSQIEYKINPITITYNTTPADKLIKGTMYMKNSDGSTSTIKGTWKWYNASEVKTMATGKDQKIRVKFTSSNKNVTVSENAEIYASVTINGAALTITGAKVKDKEYAKDDYDAEIEEVYFKCGKEVITLTKGDDYTVTGTYAKNDINDKQTVNFTVVLTDKALASYSLAKPNATAKGKITGQRVQVTVTVNGGDDVPYNGKVQKPDVVVEYKDKNGNTGTIDPKQYKLKYPSVKSGEKLVVTVTPINKSNYVFVDEDDTTLSYATGTFTISGSTPEIKLSKTTIETTYTGAAPTVKLISGTAAYVGTTKVSGTLSFDNAEDYINVGTHEVTVRFTPKETGGYYEATAKVTLVVKPATITVKKVTVASVKKSEINTATVPTVESVTFNSVKKVDNPLQLGEDYTVKATYTNIEKGTVEYEITLLNKNYVFKTTNDSVVTGTTTGKITK